MSADDDFTDQIPVEFPAAYFCPHCSEEFPDEAAIVGHLSSDRTCGRWWHQAEAASPDIEPTQTGGYEYNEDPDSLHDVEIGGDLDPFADDANEPPFPAPAFVQGLADLPTSRSRNEEDLPRPPSPSTIDPFATNNTTEQPSSAPPRMRQHHPKPGIAVPGGRNHIHLMDEDEYAHIRNTRNPYYPFSSEREWKLAQWLSSGSLSMSDIDQYLQLPHNIERPPSFKTAQELRGRIECLPEVPRWRCQHIKVGPYKTKHPIVLYWRDGLEVVEHLFRNPVFAPHMDYHPYREFEQGPMGQERVYGEFMSADHAWEIQDSLPNGNSFVGVIGASDKTPLTLGSGNKEMHPLLLSLANIHANVRMKATSHAYALAAYLPIPKFLDVSPAVQSVLAARVYHFAISIVMRNLKTAARHGTPMSDPNGFLRMIHTPLVAWIADLPEQHLISCVSSNSSPISTATIETFGNDTPCPPRRRQATLDTIREAVRLCDPCDITTFHKICLTLHLNGVVHPFWADWGSACPSIFLTPDALHQWHKFFFDHCVRWVINIMGGPALDRRLSVLQPRTGTRHWRNGVSTLKQTSGREHRDLEKLLPAVAAGGVPNEVLCALRAITEFIFLAQSIFFYDETLHALKQALREFHHYKAAILSAGGRKGKNGPLGHFRIPKLELTHNVERSVRAMGAPYQWSSDITERCHITHVKIPYRLSNHRNFHEQCCRFLDRQEKMRFFQLYTILKTCHAPLLNEIASEGSMVQLYRTVATEHGSSNVAVAPASNPTGTSLGDELTIGLPCQKGSIFEKQHAQISADDKSAILLTRRPHFPSLDVDQASHTLGICDLRPALGDFFAGRSYGARNGRRVATANCPLPFTSLHAWKKFRIQQRSVANPLSFAPPQTVQAEPPGGELPFGRANTVLIVHESGERMSSSVDSEHYLVAQVRAILQPVTSPPHSPLLYVEFFKWSTLHFQEVDGIQLVAPAPNIEMFVVRRRLRSGDRYMGDIVPLDAVRQVVQLVPKFGSTPPPSTMNCDNSLEHGGEFYLNSFASKETFHAILNIQ